MNYKIEDGGGFIYHEIYVIFKHVIQHVYKFVNKVDEKKLF